MIPAILQREQVETPLVVGGQLTKRFHLTALRPGNDLAFFPSFAYRDHVIAKLPAGGPRALLQIPGMPVAPILVGSTSGRDCR